MSYVNFISTTITTQISFDLSSTSLTCIKKYEEKGMKGNVFK